MTGAANDDDADDELSEDAKALLASLRGGDARDIAVPGIYPGGGALCEHAQAFFSCAAALCHAPRAHDFEIFGALYCLRHGLELWLKWVAQTRTMDAVLEAIGDGKDLDDVVEVALTGISKNRKREAMKVFRQAIPALRQRTPVQRRDLEKVWPIPIDGHKLRVLWKGAESYVRELYVRETFVNAPQSYMVTSDEEPLPPAKLAALCELLGKWDPGGDGIRYPAGLDGRWYVDLPSLNLRALEKLARDLESTVLAYERA